MRLSLILTLLVLRPAAAQVNPPDWARDAIWYQIYPERFRNGDPANDPTREEVTAQSDWRISAWTNDWGRLQPEEQGRQNDFYARVNDRRYGGDLQGVIDANSGTAAATMAGVMWDTAVEAGVQLATQRGNTLYTITEAEKEKWRKATQPVIDRWRAASKQKGFDGGALLDEAQHLIEKYSTT
mgnify:CR=1 FL=1